ncbi:MAG: hypothetical protein P9M15_04865 [Candidatus Electryoneaceae bacterium]|nr:hypothetical protein [Candidatus Electryoneaceae bacterium]
MAIWGIGAIYNGVEDKYKSFITEGFACIGWDEKNSPSLHYMMKHIKRGDIIFIKAFVINGRYLRVKAIGIAIDDVAPPPRDKDLGEIGVRVRWVWEGQEDFRNLDDSYNVRSITLYEENNPVIQNRIIALLTSQTGDIHNSSV